MDFSLIIESMPIYLDGLWTTVWLVGLALIVGLAVSIPLAIARNSENYFFYGPSWAYIYFFLYGLMCYLGTAWILGGYILIFPLWLDVLSWDSLDIRRVYIDISCMA